MFKLVTGSPGDGKTSNELWDFLHAPEYNNRPKYCTPVNGFKPEDHGVTAIEHINVWQDLPDGSVIFCDEIQDYAGTDIGKVEPEWVKQLARHRHRGFDFICTTQSPMFLHSFVRKLAKPHVHYIRPWNMKGIRYSWETVQNDPNTKMAKASGVRTPVKPNPEVFKLYTSTVLDTHKSRPPYKVFILLALMILLAVGGGGFAFYRVSHMGDKFKAGGEVAELSKPGSKAVDGPLGVPNAALTPGTTNPVWTDESVKPRVRGMPFSAPVYDQITQPSDFPRVSACMSSESKGCNCYTQQGTPVDVPSSACLVYVRVGSFDPWLSSRRASQAQQRQNVAQSSPVDSKAAKEPVRVDVIEASQPEKAPIVVAQNVPEVRHVRGPAK
jgi:zona occludens toxin